MTVCNICHCVLGHDHEGARVCSPCLRSRRDYNPRHDPHFVDSLAALFEAHFDEVVCPGPSLGIGIIHHHAVTDGMEVLRRRGWVFETRPPRPGYRAIGQPPTAPPRPCVILIERSE